jgi:hypothetical protein
MLNELTFEVRSEKVFVVQVGSKKHHFTILDPNDTASGWRVAVLMAQSVWAQR